MNLRADEALNARAIDELGIEPGTVVRIPATECCGSMPWDCSCPRICEGCGETVSGPGACGDCCGGRE